MHVSPTETPDGKQLTFGLARWSQRERLRAFWVARSYANRYHAVIQRSGDPTIVRYRIDV